MRLRKFVVSFGMDFEVTVHLNRVDANVALQLNLYFLFKVENYLQIWKFIASCHSCHVVLLELMCINMAPAQSTIIIPSDGFCLSGPARNTQLCFFFPV